MTLAADLTIDDPNNILLGIVPMESAIFIHLNCHNCKAMGWSNDLVDIPLSLALTFI